MRNYEQEDNLLKQALSPTAEPDEALNQKVINLLKEKNIMKPVLKKRVAAILIAAVVAVAMSATAFAAWKLLNPSQVAEHFGNRTLAQAFKGKDAIKIDKTVVSGGYSITLLGVTSGEWLNDFKSSVQDLHPDRTYAVVSIARQDGAKMPDTRDEEYGKVPFFVSPLIKGQKPWQVNIASMNGGYSEAVIDGVMYRLIECDGIEMFADRGLYLSVSTSNFYDIKAFNYNEKTGEISVNPDFDGANAIFDLPLDTKKADHDKAEKYLQELLKEPEGDSASGQNPENTGSDKKQAESEPGEGKPYLDLKKEAENGVLIPESVKEVTVDEDGMAYYEFGSAKVGVNINFLFKEGETGTKFVSVNGSDNNWTAILFSRAADGTITGKTVKIE